MSQPTSLEDIPQLTRTDRKPVPTRTDVDAETVDVYNSRGTGPAWQAERARQETTQDRAIGPIQQELR